MGESNDNNSDIKTTTTKKKQQSPNSTLDPPPSFFAELEKLLNILAKCETPHPKAARANLMRSLMNMVPEAREEEAKTRIARGLDPVIRCMTSPERNFFGSHTCWLRSVPCLIYALTLLLYMPQNGVLVESTSPEFCDNFFAEQPALLELCIKVLFWRSHDPEVFVELEDLRQQGKLFPGYSYEQMQDSTVRMVGRFLNGSIHEVERMAEVRKKKSRLKPVLKLYARGSKERALWIASLSVSDQIGLEMTFGTSVLDIMLHCVENPDLTQCLKSMLVIAQRLTMAAKSMDVLGPYSMSKLCELASKVPGQISAKTVCDIILSGLREGDDGTLVEAVDSDLVETILHLLAKFCKAVPQDVRQERLLNKFHETTKKIVDIIVSGSGESELVKSTLLKHSRSIQDRVAALVDRGYELKQATAIAGIFAPTVVRV